MNNEQHNIELAKKYRKYKNNVLDSVNCINEKEDIIELYFEGYDVNYVNYIGIGKFFEILVYLEKYGFDISHKGVGFCPDDESNNYELTIGFESNKSTDKLHDITIYIGTYNIQYFDEGYEINTPMEEFCKFYIIGEYTDGESYESDEYIVERKDMENFTNLLKELLKLKSPDEVITKITEHYSKK